MVKELFKVNEETYLVELNKTWISTIPEFERIIKEDKGTKGDTQARKKLHAKRVFTFIYHYCDFQSQFIDMDEDERRENALSNAQLLDEDITTTVEIAIDKYILLQDTRTLKLLRKARGAMDRLGEYFDEIDYTERDAGGKLVYEPKTVMGNIGMLDKAHDGLQALEKRVKLELKQEARLRGDENKSEWEDPDDF